MHLFLWLLERGSNTGQDHGLLLDLSACFMGGWVSCCEVFEEWLTNNTSSLVRATHY